MTKDTLLIELKRLDNHSYFYLDSTDYVFDVSRLKIFETDSILFALHGGILHAYSLDKYEYEEIVNIIDSHIYHFNYDRTGLEKFEIIYE
ncbi:hypothetical protein [Paraliobacillus ryukyuensis]|uniref:hypothetical protein n=1 Tax=Paraliobacillus ryukyuensis TaxID=200904 RepID=UPI0009A8A2FE|nr:hypothetical protein [Paraliobacillus ryukyuensis]